MSLKSGFFNSKNHDRVYDARDFSSIFDGIIRDGVYQGIGDSFLVTPGIGLSVQVGSGRAWFESTWTVNEGSLPLYLDDADGSLGRIDAIVLKVDTTDEVRGNSIEVIKGTNSSAPTKPTLTDSDGVYYHPLAWVTVNAGATAITVANIEIAVGSDERTPFADLIWSVGDFAYPWATIPDDLLGPLMNKVDRGWIGLQEDLGWAIGDERIVTMYEGGYQRNITMVLGDPNHYELATPTPSGRLMNNFVVFPKEHLELSIFSCQYSDTGSYVSWPNSKLRKYLHETILPYFPSGLRSIMKPFKVYTATNNSGTLGSSTDTLSVFAEKEVFGNRTYSPSSEESLTQLDIFKNNLDIYSSWITLYLRSPSTNNTNQVCAMNSYYTSSGGPGPKSQGVGNSSGSKIFFCI